MKSLQRWFAFVLASLMLCLFLPVVARAAAVDHVPCRVKQKVSAAFPPRLMYEGVLRGKALLALEVDETGGLNDVLVVACTRRPFADAAVAAVRRWEFTPGALGREKIISRINVTFEFELSGVIATARSIASLRLDELVSENLVHRPYRSHELDRPLRALQQAAPIYPRQWLEEGRRGSVVIEFYVDENGATRMPCRSRMATKRSRRRRPPR